MVPSAGLEPAWVTPYAPQTYVSTNSTTTARGTILRLHGALRRGRRMPAAGCGRSRGRAPPLRAPAPRRSRGLRGRRAPGASGSPSSSAAPPGSRAGSESRMKADEGSRRQLVQERRRAARAEGGLAAAAAEGAGDVRALPLLEQDDQDQEETDDDVDDDQGDVQQRASTKRAGSVRAGTRGVKRGRSRRMPPADRLAPPIRNPSTRLREDSSRGVLGRDRAAVEDPQTGRARRGAPPGAHRGRRGVLGTWRRARSRSPRPARRPRRAAQLVGSAASVVDLALEDRRRSGPASRSSRRLAEAVDRRQARLPAPRAACCARTGRVLAEEAAPLRVPDDGVSAAGVRAPCAPRPLRCTPPSSPPRRSGRRATSAPLVAAPRRGP